MTTFLGEAAGLRGTCRRCCVGTTAANGAVTSLVMSAPVHLCPCAVDAPSPHLSSAEAVAVGKSSSRARGSVSSPAPFPSRTRALRGSPPPPAAWIAAANPLNSGSGSSFALCVSPPAYTAHLLFRCARGTAAFLDDDGSTARSTGAGRRDASPGFSRLASS